MAERFTGRGRPSTKQLDNHVVQVAVKWRDVGVQLLKDNSILDIIEANYKQDVVRCCQEMFKKWLETAENASWDQLLEALRSPNVQLVYSANQIEQNLKLVAQSQSESVRIQSDHQGSPESDGEQMTQQTDTKSLVISKEEFESYNDVGKAFIALHANMEILLKTANFRTVRRACITQMHNPGGADLSQSVQEISRTQDIDDLLDLLVHNPYWSWIDIRLLEVMVIASKNPQARKLLDNYKAVVFSNKLIDVLPNVPSKKIKDKYYSRVVSKVKQDHNEMTVADLLKFQSQLEVVIMDITKGICILKHLKKGCIEIHWYIPTSCVDGAYRAARVKCCQFNDLQLQYLKIGDYPVIHDPLASPDVVVSAPSPPVNVATVKDFIDHYYDYLSVNMDAEVVAQLMVSQQLLSEDVVMAASSDYLKNCLILQQVRLMNVQSVLSFGELLQSNDSQKCIGTMLIDGLQSSLLSPNTIAQSAVDQEDTTTEHTKQEDKEELATKNDMIDPSSVITEFLNMKVQLEELLQQYDPLPIVKKCGSLLASDTHNIPLFPTDYTEKLQEIRHTPELIQKLSPFMTWDNHTILSTIAADMPEATMLLTQFDGRIASSQPLTSFPIPAPSHHMVPYNNSTHTVLAVKLDLELYQSTLQNVIDARSLIQDQCKLTSHCLRLLAMARTKSTILYWMIPKVVATLIYSKVLENPELFHRNGVMQLALYPGSIFLTDGTLKVGPLSFFHQFDVPQWHGRSRSDTLNNQLSQLEEIPNLVDNLQSELIKSNKEIKATKAEKQLCIEKLVVEKQKGKHFHYQLQQISNLTKELLYDISSEIQDPIDVITTFKQLITELKESKDMEKLLKDKVLKEQQKFSDLLVKYDDLRLSPLLSQETQVELTELLATVKEVNSSVQKVEVIQQYWNTKSQDTAKEDSKSSEIKLLEGDLEPFTAKLRVLNRDLKSIEECLQLLQLLHTELSDSKEENKVKLTEMSLQLMMKENELTKVKEDNKLFVKQFIERKEKKRRETIIMF